MCRVKTFCCCCGLRGAAITAAVFNAFYVLGKAVMCFYFFRAYFTGEHDEVPKKDRDSDSEVISYGTTPIPPEIMSTAYLLIAIFATIRLVVAVIVLVLLCIGINKNRPGYVSPWLVMAMILIVSELISVVGFFISGVHWAELLGDLLACAFWIYLWIAVYSYYKDLQEGGPATAYVA